MTKVATAPFDGAKYIRTPEAVIELLSDALESGESGYVTAALGAIARDVQAHPNLVGLNLVRQDRAGGANDHGPVIGSRELRGLHLHRGSKREQLRCLREARERPQPRVPPVCDDGERGQKLPAIAGDDATYR